MRAGLAATGDFDGGVGDLPSTGTSHITSTGRPGVGMPREPGVGGRSAIGRSATFDLLCEP